MLFTITIMLLVALLTANFLGAIGTITYGRREKYIRNMIIVLIVIAALYGMKSY